MTMFERERRFNTKEKVCPFECGALTPASLQLRCAMEIVQTGRIIETVLNRVFNIRGASGHRLTARLTQSVVTQTASRASRVVCLTGGGAHKDAELLGFMLLVGSNKKVSCR